MNKTILSHIIYSKCALSLAVLCDGINNDNFALFFLDLRVQAAYETECIDSVA